MLWMPTVTGNSSSSSPVDPSAVRGPLDSPIHRNSQEVVLHAAHNLNQQRDHTIPREESSIKSTDEGINTSSSSFQSDTERTSLGSQSFESSAEPRIEDIQMGRKSGTPRRRESDRSTSRDISGQNGHASGSMDPQIELRRKHPSLESSSSAPQTARLMGRDDFSLDEKPPLTPTTSSSDTSFFDLPRQDRRNFLLLVLLYFLQGIPMGLAQGSVPFLLKSHLSYGQIGVFSLAAYPYSLKLLWSPIVDALWSPALGRRKSWILPIQTCSGLGMIYLGGRIKDMMVSAGASDGSGVWSFTGWWFFLVFLCATQDIAVDGSYISAQVVAESLTRECRLGPHSSLSS